MTSVIEVDELRFELIRSPNRNTMEIIIERNGELSLRIPERCSDEEAQAFAASRLTWIYTKLGERELFQRPAGEKEIVNGEGFFFLGDSYRLMLIENQEEPLLFDGELFRMSLTTPEDGRGHFINWYILQGQEWLSGRVHSIQTHFLVDVPEIRVMDLGNRWGSCSQDGSINLHWRTMLLPPRIIDYIIYHELAHIHHPNHSKEYWNALETAMPDYRERKNWLAENGGLFFL
jgi:predicted metal-dependent hydrolase